MVGEYNSSITRVRPIFQYLLDTDHTGISWLPKLCQLAANKRPVGSAIKAPEFLGQIRPYTIETREYNDRTLSKRGIESIELARTFEMSLPPPNNFLEWLVNNPEKMIQRDTQNPLRKKLFSSDINERNEVKKQALKEIEQYKYNKYGSNKPSNAWWMFEGYSEIDCCFQT